MASPRIIPAYTRCYICMSEYSGGGSHRIRKEHGKCCLLFRFLFQTVCRRCHIHTKSFPALPYRSPTQAHRDRYTNRGMPYLHCHCSIFYNSVKMVVKIIYGCAVAVCARCQFSVVRSISICRKSHIFDGNGKLISEYVIGMIVLFISRAAVVFGIRLNFRQSTVHVFVNYIRRAGRHTGNPVTVVVFIFRYPEIFADISRRAIKPRLYNTKEKKTVIRYSVRQPFFGCPANYVPHFPDTRVCRPRKSALLPTERIRQKQRCRKRFSAACGIKSFNSLSWRSGFGGHKRRKGEICFWKIFCRNRASETVFCSFAYLYGKKRQNVTKKLFILQKIHKMPVQKKCL